MNGGGAPEEHWLDRLAAPHTRRHGLRAALAAAAMTLPLLRPVARAFADDPHACQKGCLWESHQIADSDLIACALQGQAAFWLVYGLGPVVGLSFLSPGVGGYKGVERMVKCGDRASLEEKTRQFRCGQPGCPGFDPYVKGGPCDGCKDNCCTCQSIDSGYICCVYDCNDPMHNCCPVA